MNTQQEFDQYAGDYEKMIDEPARKWFAGVDFFHRRKMEVLTSLLRSRGLDPRKMRWLDFGCGKGDLLTLGKQSFAASYGCDVSQEMLAAAQGLETRLQESPGMVPFEDSSFDLVTAVCVYHHVPPPERAALTAEIARTLKPGGTLAIIEHNPFNPMTQIVVKRCPVDINAILLRAGEAKALQQQAGLTPYATSYFLFVPEMLFRRLGGIEPWLSWLPAGGQYMQLARRG